MSDNAGPAAAFCQAMLDETPVYMVVVVCVLATDAGVVRIDSAAGQRALPASCTRHTAALQDMIEEIRAHTEKCIHRTELDGMRRGVRPTQPDGD
jgi:hypothetical protein